MCIRDSIKGLLAGAYILKAVATDNDGGVTTKQITITVTSGIVVNNLPSVNISSPTSNSSFTAPASVNVQVNASDSDGSISKVEFYNGNTLLNSDTSVPYSFTITNLATGSYSIIVKAVDDLGGVSSSSVNVTVNHVITPPTASGINGPSCVTAGSTLSYTLVPESSSVTTINYWSNSGAVIIKDISDSKKITMQFPSYANSSTIILSAGVNYSMSPWYKEYTKTIKVGGCSAKVSAVLSPQPTVDFSIVTLDDNQSILSIIIFNSIGEVVYQAENINSTSISLGNELAAGVYIVQVISPNGTAVTRMLKR